jgi:tetratricopeptide (TPR) repeat protein
MADEPDPNANPSESTAGSERGRSSPRRQALTPEVRRFLGGGRSRHDREAAKAKAAEQAADLPPESSSTEVHETAPPPTSQWSPPVESMPAPQPKPERPRTSPPAATVVSDQKISRALEMQTVALVIGGIILLGATFYFGTKMRSLKAFLASRNKPQLANVDAQKFPGLSSDELVEQALAVERLGNWREAVERLLVAKQRNLRYRGILYRAGKLCYDHGDFNGADRLFERATAFGEQVDTANYMRGLIALGRNDLPAAEQFFEAAINAEPFTPGYYFNLAEALRREHRLKEAINRYEQAGARAGNEPDRTLCQFKARIATAETADVSQLENEIAKKRTAGPLSVDWLLTDAALKLRLGQIAEAAQLIQQARSADTNLPNVFASYTSDMLFTEAATRHPEIADACRVSGVSVASSPTPNPFATP